MKNSNNCFHLLYMYLESRLKIKGQLLGCHSVSVVAGQAMVWAIFHLLPINLKFQWAILSKFNIAISVVNGPFFC